MASLPTKQLTGYLKVEDNSFGGDIIYLCVGNQNIAVAKSAYHVESVKFVESASGEPDIYYEVIKNVRQPDTDKANSSYSSQRVSVGVTIPFEQYAKMIDKKIS